MHRVYNCPAVRSHTFCLVQIATNLRVRFVQNVYLFHQCRKELVLLLHIAPAPASAPAGSADVAIDIERGGGRGAVAVAVDNDAIGIATLGRILSTQLGIVIRWIQQTGIAEAKAATERKIPLEINTPRRLTMHSTYPRLMFGLLPLPSSTSVEFCSCSEPAPPKPLSTLSSGGKLAKSCAPSLLCMDMPKFRPYPLTWAGKSTG